MFKKVLRNIVFVEPEEFRTQAGLYVAGKTEYHVGRVVDVGEGIRKEVCGEEIFQPTDVKPGDRVFYDWAVGNRVTINGKDYLYMTEQGIAGILDDDAVIGQTGKGNGTSTNWD